MSDFTCNVRFRERGMVSPVLEDVLEKPEGTCTVPIFQSRNHGGSNSNAGSADEACRLGTAEVAHRCLDL
jgi:hypothetical protein